MNCSSLRIRRSASCRLTPIATVATPITISPSPVSALETTYGIWNAASQMETRFTQRFDIYQVNCRFPMWETQDFRTYGLFGPRIVWIWERFSWRSVERKWHMLSVENLTSLLQAAVPLLPVIFRTEHARLWQPEHLAQHIFAADGRDDVMFAGIDLSA